MTNEEIKALKASNAEMKADDRAAKKAAALDGCRDGYATRSRRGAAQKLFVNRRYFVVDFRKGSGGSSNFHWVDVVLIDKETGREVVTSMTALMYKNPYGNTKEVGGIQGLPCDTVDQFMDWILDNTGAEIQCTYADRVTPTKVWDNNAEKYVAPSDDNPARATWVYAAKLV